MESSVSFNTKRMVNQNFKNKVRQAILSYFQKIKIIIVLMIVLNCLKCPFCLSSCNKEGYGFRVGIGMGHRGKDLTWVRKDDPVEVFLSCSLDRFQDCFSGWILFLCKI